MTSIKPKLNYRPDMKGRFTLILQIIHNRRRGVVFSPYHVLPEEFNHKKGKVVAPDRTKAARTRAAEINDFIFSQTAELKLVVQQLKLSANCLPPKRLRLLTVWHSSSSTFNRADWRNTITFYLRNLRAVYSLFVYLPPFSSERNQGGDFFYRIKQYRTYRCLQ